jgi:pectin methylesterase-like acyl-CoA thioesterase
MLGGVAALIAISVVLAGCAGFEPVPQPTARATEAAGVTPPADPAPSSSLRPALSAGENLSYFDSIASAVLAAEPKAGGKAFIDALAAGGFDKGQMEVTFDRTATGLDADSIQFAVRFNGECLIGQTGPASKGFHSMVAPILGSGKCLVGATRQIDW